MRRTGTIVMLAVLALLALAGTVVLTQLRRVTSAPYLEARLNERLAVATEGLYRVRLGGSWFDPLRRTFAVTHFVIAPDSAAWEQLAAAKKSDMRASLRATSLHLQGIDVWGLLRGRVAIGTATLEQPVVEVFLNRKASSTAPPRPARLPHDLLEKIQRPFRIDALVVKDGSVRYSELALDGARPGSIRFENVGATVRSITNVHPAGSQPCRIDVHTLLAGEGAADLTLDYDLAAPGLFLKYRGTIGRMSAEALNEILENLLGLQVTSGVLDSTWFDFDVHDDVATGRVQVLYHDLSTKVIDKVTRERGASERLKTFVSNTFVIAGSNPPAHHSPPLVIPVQHKRLPKDNLFRFLWVIVRDGVYKTLGI